LFLFVVGGFSGSLLVLNGGFCLFCSIAPSLLADSALGSLLVINGGFCLFYSIVPSLLADSPLGSLLVLMVSACCSLRCWRILPLFIVILMAVSACFVALFPVVGGFLWVHC
jgi:hypothetical protein